MTCWTPCAAPGPTGFDLDEAVLLSPDVLDGGQGRRTSRATATPWRESLWRTGSGEHVVGIDTGGAGSSGLDVDRWRWVSPVLAEDWLRRQGLDETADALFAPLPDRPPTRLAVHLDHADLACLEQLCADDGTTVEAVLQQAVSRYLEDRATPTAGLRVVDPTPWWPVGVARDLGPGRLGPSHPVARRAGAETMEP